MFCTRVGDLAYQSGQTITSLFGYLKTSFGKIWKTLGSLGLKKLQLLINLISS